MPRSKFSWPYCPHVWVNLYDITGDARARSCFKCGKYEEIKMTKHLQTRLTSKPLWEAYYTDDDGERISEVCYGETEKEAKRKLDASTTNDSDD